MKELVLSVNRLKDTVKHFESIAAPTGLALSMASLASIDRLRNGLSPERIDPEGHGPGVFREVLGVDRDMAHELYLVLSHRHHPERLVDLPGMDGKLLDKIRERFVLRGALA